MIVYAEEVNYWKTGQSSADTWIDKAKAEIKAAGGRVVSETYGRDGDGRGAFLLEFVFGQERYKAIWPVLPTRTKKEVDERAARIQAATMLYHDVKAKAVSAKVHGLRAAFFQYLVLPDGRTAAQVATPELAAAYPKMLQASPNVPV
jgi:hypothetical protein